MVHSGIGVIVARLDLPMALASDYLRHASIVIDPNLEVSLACGSRLAAQLFTIDERGIGPALQNPDRDLTTAECINHKTSRGLALQLR